MPAEYYKQLAQGVSKKLSDRQVEESERSGYTHPDLHIRVDPQTPPSGDVERRPRDYVLSVGGTHSYRTTIKHMYDDTDNPDEIP